jgi:drug/metabolite transporter (DMT)-like permease
VVAILGGVGAAAAWAASTLCSSRSSRMIGPTSVVSWMALTGLLVTAPVVAAEGVPAHLHGATIAWLVLSGAGNVAGLLVAYVAYRQGDVALIAPVICTEGAIAAVIAFAFGESVNVATAVTLTVIAAGVTLAAIPARGGAAAHSPASSSRRVVGLAALAALSFGVGLYATGRVSSQLPVAWVVISARALAVVFVALPLALGGRLRLTARALPLVIASGLCEVLGFAAFTLGARHDIAVAAVLSCQFAALSAVGAYVLFRERLARPQLVGVIVLLVGVSALSGLRG